VHEEQTSQGETGDSARSIFSFEIKLIKAFRYNLETHTYTHDLRQHERECNTKWLDGETTKLWRWWCGAGGSRACFPHHPGFPHSSLQRALTRAQAEGAKPPSPPPEGLRGGGQEISPRYHGHISMFSFLGPPVQLPSTLPWKFYCHQLPLSYFKLFYTLSFFFLRLRFNWLKLS
jgi:hypothetical protein